MLITGGRQLPSTLIVFDDESGSDQKRFGDLADRSTWQTDDGCNHVQSLGSVRQDRDITLLDWTEADTIDLLK